MEKKNDLGSILKKRSVADIIAGLACMLYAAESSSLHCILLLSAIGFFIVVIGTVGLVACKVQEDEESMIVR